VKNSDKTQFNFVPAQGVLMKAHSFSGIMKIFRISGLYQLFFSLIGYLFWKFKIQDYEDIGFNRNRKNRFD